MFVNSYNFPLTVTRHHAGDGDIAHHAGDDDIARHPGAGPTRHSGDRRSPASFAASAVGAAPATAPSS
ncbi:MAG: hypothetical protein OXU88_02595 [Gammaproteobacteria bacterium]|nr:hypothetical protein [Gammaproteobacteria bacterium]